MPHFIQKSVAGQAEQKKGLGVIIALPRNGAAHFKAAATEAESEAVWRSVVRGSPFGEPSWAEETAKRLRLESTLRQRGRPRKATDDAHKV
jgi:REP-associated tyrosine transposase